MAIAALITWILTALGGFYMLSVWIARGGLRREEAGSTRFPPPVIFGHMLLAAAGLIVWIIYVAADKQALAWTAFVILLPVALLGFVMLARWIPTYRARAAAGPGAGSVPAERAIPVAVVAGHGLLAVVTLVLVLLTAATG
ncbi:hypothetical protein [Actinomadura macrotermitis]|uniref:DUF2269 family protein n=1 Tax=Actinomadura macrotermitis TaxID=2585200 RepID=A0A7K0BRF7_9ACTN|nr:hypothetical protein [Actinomadura macrotermitis]MQY03785.1 hypothetical protein [Actinomadura macrotermitis]